MKRQDPNENRNTSSPLKGRGGPLAALLIIIAVAVATAIFFPKLKDAAVITPAAGTVSIADTDVLDRIGLSAEELPSIRFLILAGDRAVIAEDVNALLINERDGDVSRWIWSEDGSEVEKGSIEDLSFLSMLPELRRLYLVNQSAKVLPDLSGDRNLYQVDLADCDFESIEGLSGCNSLKYVNISLDRLTDLSPLSGCPMLTSLSVSSGKRLRTLDVLSAPKLRDLTLHSDHLQDISALENMGGLVHLELYSDLISDFSAIGTCASLRELSIESHRGTVDLSFLSSISKLTDFDCQCADFCNLEGISESSQLKHFRLGRDGDPAAADLNCLKGMKLTELRLSNVDTDLRFLKGMHSLQLVDISGRISSWEGLGQLSKIEELCVYGGGKSADGLLKAVSVVNVSQLELYDCGRVDLSLMPKKVSSLTLHNCSVDSLEGIRCTSLRYLKLSSLNGLTGLDGIEALTKLLDLGVYSCLHMNDWSAVYGKELKELSICGQYTLPDLSRLNFKKNGGLRLESIPGMTDAELLKGLDSGLRTGSSFTLELVGDEIISLDALEGFRMKQLIVSPELEEQAAGLVEKGCFQNYEINYPDGNWDDAFENFSLASLDELDTLPDAVLAKLKRIYLGGDEVFSDGWFNSSGDIGTNYTFIQNDDEEEYVQTVLPGHIKDLSAFYKLTGLEELVLVNEPLESLEGIQNFTKLKTLQLMGCSITDISSAFAADTLEAIILQDCPFLTSIDGIQNLSRLCELNIQSTPVTDYSPLKELDTNSAFSLRIVGFDPSCRPEDFSFLSCFNSFDSLELHVCPAEDWLEYIQDTKVREALLFSCFSSTEEFERFIGSVYGLEALNIEHNSDICSLECLLSLDVLKSVRISGDMDLAHFSLDGLDFGFDLETGD